jgi:hypothetical protein
MTRVTSIGWLCHLSRIPSLVAAGILTLPLYPQAQENSEDSDIFEISPFEIVDDSDVGYLASQTMAGGRLRSNLRDVGSSIQVVTQEFMEDIGATGIEELLQYTTSTEIAGSLGNFTGVSEGLDGQVNTGGARGNPDGTSRVRGLAAPDRTRNFYKTDIPFDTYNTDRIDINRGANSFLFGLGSPAGLVNNGMARARFEDSGEVQFRIGSGGDRPSYRLSANINKVLIEDTIAMKVAFLNDATEYRQQPTYKDDQRFYATITIQPFKTPNTVIRAYIESGEVTGNAPDTVGPVENLSTFLDEPIQGRRSYDIMANLRNFNNMEGPNNNRNNQPDRNPDGVPLRTLNDPQVLVPYVGLGYGLIFDGSNGQNPAGAFNARIQNTDFVKRTNNNRDANPFFDPLVPGGNGVQGNIDWGFFQGNYSQIQETAEGWAFQGLTDLNTFDFTRYNLGWDNDFYSRDFENHNIALEQVLFNGNAGFEIGYDFQTLFRSDYNALSNGAARLVFDVNESIPVPVDLNYRESGNTDYLPNPNFGRPAIQTNGNNRESTFDRETFRFTGFLKHSFKDQLDESTLGKILGSHTITALMDDYSEEEVFVPYQLSSFGNDFNPGLTLGTGDAKIANNGQRNIRNLIYIGPQQLNAFSDPSFTISDFIIEPAKYDLRSVAGQTYDLIYWDLGDDVTEDNFGLGNHDNGNETHKRGLLRPELTPGKNHRKQLTEVESVAFNTQSFIFDDLLVVNMGWRSDKVKTWLNTEALTEGFDEIPDLDPQNWTLYDGNATYREIDSEIFGYGGVLNWPHKLIELPSGVDVAFHYNETENFVPAATRIDPYRQPLESPSGLSKDWGVTFFLFDNKVVSRFNWYDADLSNATANLSGVFNQTIQRMFATYGNLNGGIFDADNNGDGIVDQQFLDSIPPVEEGMVETDEEKIARVIPFFQESIAARDAIEPFLNDALKASYAYRELPGGRNEVTGAGNVADTQDIQAKGFEWELTMNPTRSWRVSLNFADTETVLTNIGPGMTELFNGFWLPYLEDHGTLDFNDPLGEVEGNTIRQQVNQDVLEYLEQKAQEGSPTLEQRRYRVNFVTNYTFREGALQGFSVGGAARWQSNNAVGFPLIPNDDNLVIPDIENPWYNEEELNYDLTLAYRKKISDKINWTVQLNLRNLNNLDSDELSTVRRQPNGKVARVRYDPPFQVLLTNTFRF